MRGCGWIGERENRPGNIIEALEGVGGRHGTTGQTVGSVHHPGKKVRMKTEIFLDGKYQGFFGWFGLGRTHIHSIWDLNLGFETCTGIGIGICIGIVCRIPARLGPIFMYAVFMYVGCWTAV